MGPAAAVAAATAAGVAAGRAAVAADVGGLPVGTPVAWGLQATIRPSNSADSHNPRVIHTSLSQCKTLTYCEEYHNRGVLSMLLSSLTILFLLPSPCIFMRGDVSRAHFIGMISKEGSPSLIEKREEKSLFE